MRSVALALCFLLPLTSAVKTTLRRVETTRSTAGPRALYPVINAATGEDDVDLVNSLNVVYMAAISIGGVDYTVQLDSGSSDLWVRPHGTGTLAGATDTQLTYNITYSIGYAAGNIVTVPVEFAGYTVASQAVLQVTSSDNPVFSFGADGVFGLGFTSLSNVDRTVTAAGGDYGHDFLYNVFAQNSSAPNFIAFQLERKNDLASDTDSIFAIGELEAKYNGISQTQKISTWPVSSPKRWSVLLDGYEYADGIKRTLATKVDGAPSSIILLDTGASYAYASQDLVTGLYGSVQGASFDSTKGMWVVPCDQEVNFSLWIGGRKFNWDPLDVVVPSIGDNTTCVGSIIPTSSLSGFDFHAGDVFLRSLYTVFDFGDFDASGKMGDPYVRLWSLINQPTASAEFHQIRGGTAQVYKSSSNADPNAPSATPDVPTNASSDDTVSAEQEMAKNIKTLVSYAPIALGVLGLNALLLVVILSLGLSFICKRKKKRIASRASPAGGLSINSALSRTHSYRQVKGEDVDTPMAQLNFTDDPETPHSMKKSHTSSYYANGDALDSPADAGSPSTIRKSHAHTPSKASGLAQMSHPLSPSRNSTFGDAQAAGIPLPKSATSLVFPGDRPASPTGGSVRRTPSPLALSATKGATDLADVSLIDESLSPSDPQHPATPSIEIAPPQQQQPSRSQEYLAAMEARRAALAGAGDARRNTYHDEQEEPMEPPRRFGAGGDGRRAMSTYYNNGAPANLEPLQVPSRRPPPPPVDSPQDASFQPDETSPLRDNNPSPPPSAGFSSHSQEISMPPGPSRSQEYLAAMEARKAAMTESQDSSQRNSLGPLQPPPRRFNSGDGRRATYNAQPAPGEGDRGTIYFDAPDTPVDSPSSPMYARSGPYSPASPQAPSAHGRTGSTSSMSRGSPLKSSMKSPTRSTFNPAGQPPPVPRSSSHLNPGSSLLPPRRPTDPQHARAGSYAGSSSAPRVPSNMAPPLRSAGWNPRAMPGEEEDLAEQRMDLSFEERANMQADAFGDGQAAPRRPFAPTSAPGYRYSSVQ